MDVIDDEHLEVYTFIELYKFNNIFINGTLIFDKKNTNILTTIIVISTENNSK